MIVLPKEKSFEKCLCSWILKVKCKGSPDKYCYGTCLPAVGQNFFNRFGMDKISEGQVEAGRDN